MTETLQDQSRIHAPLDAFDGYLLLVLIVIPDRQVDNAHAAFSNHARDPPRTQAAPQVAVHAVGRHPRGHALHRCIQRFAARAIEGEQRLYFAAQRLIPIAGLLEERLSRPGRQLRRRFEKLLDAPPALRLHGVAPVSSPAM